MLYNKDNLYIDTKNNAVLRYLFTCPVINELVFERITECDLPTYNNFNLCRVEQEFLGIVISFIASTITGVD